MPDPSAPRRPRFAVRRTWELIAPYYGGSLKLLVALAAMSVVTGLSEAAILYLVVRLAVAISAGHDVIDLHLGPVSWTDASLGAVLGVAGTVLVGRALLSGGEAVLTARISADTLRRARRRVLTDFLWATWSLQAQEREGKLQELLSTHVNRIANGAAMISNGIVAFFNFVAIVASAVLLSPVAALTAVVGVTFLAALLRPLLSRTRRYSQAFALASNEYSGRVAETVRLAQEIQVFDVTEEVLAVMARRVDDSVRPFFRSRLVARLTPDLYQTIALGFVLLALALVWGVGIANATEVGAVIILLLRGLTYSQQLQSVVQQANELAPYIAQYSEQYQRYEQERRRPGNAPLGEVHSLAFESVSYSYTPGVPVLRSVTFALRPGEAVGVVGPSGSGKSTLVQLLLRLRAPDTGRYLVNGLDAAAFAPEHFARHFAYVPQENKLVYGTIADNIRFHRTGYSDDQVIAAARRAYIHDDIAKMPDEYDTMVGPGGADLSGGQQQRVGLARGLLSDPAVLILDEPTSALDLRSEALVQRTLSELHGSVTLILIAHRMTTLSICDRLIVLRDGALEAFGPRDEVAQSNEYLRQASELSAASVDVDQPRRSAGLG